jgi:hypothetical protein
MRSCTLQARQSVPEYFKGERDSKFLGIRDNLSRVVCCVMKSENVNVERK